ncbi:alpha/beta hydrolase [Bacillus sp. MUM 13]|uniref:alpha/beta fold hydrolase n=1 Tax=Bacillus sp. MUM 13 TaxID=1678001 RepID=UPI0008F5B67D|nr:alpha/beta hydrolase [Bacillus sp. MUM 13]OIK12240.1 proline iminopeptidase [Bacillus sp. MUM 13]
MSSYNKQTQLIKVLDTILHVKIIGEGNPIVFLHGGPGSEHGFFLPHVLPLAKEFQLILYDQRGCGKSYPADSNKYTMKAEVEALEALRKELEFDKINVFGESWGSMLALLYASSYPNRVNKLFLTAAIGANAEGLVAFEKELLKRLSTIDKLKVFFINIGMKTGLITMDSMVKVLDPYYLFSKDALIRKLNTKINHNVNHILGDDMRNNYNLTEQLFRLDHIPVLVAQGSHDMITPAHIRDLLIKYIPHAELIEIQDCGHWTVVEQPDKINHLASRFFSNNTV